MSRPRLVCDGLSLSSRARMGRRGKCLLLQCLSCLQRSYPESPPPLPMQPPSTGTVPALLYCRARRGAMVRRCGRRDGWAVRCKRGVHRPWPRRETRGSPRRH
eukprot:6205167-Pleurochrysis_carterae.AAC.2